MDRKHKQNKRGYNIMVKLTDILIGGIIGIGGTIAVIQLLGKKLQTNTVTKTFKQFRES